MRQRLAPVLNLLFPPQCLRCAALVADHGTLCTSCWSAVAFITAPLCHRCGTPFDYDLGPDVLCETCTHAPPEFSAARAAMRYDDASRALVLKLKFQDETHLAAHLAGWLARAGEPLLSVADVLIPVPLHYRRLLLRRYNQAALLAQALGKHSGHTVWVDALLRVRHTQPQTGMTRRRRQANLRRAFQVAPRYAEQVRGQRVLLIDDVCTTGATLGACAEVLRAAGAADVMALTLARRVL